MTGERCLLRDGRLHAPEADVGHAGVGAASVPGARAVARTIAVVAQERAAFLDTLRHERPGRVDGPVRPGRVDCEPAGARAIQIALVPVRAPLPDVAGHVVEAVTVRRERLDRGGALVAVLDRVAVGKLALPDVALRPRLGERLVAPGVPLVVQAAAGGELPFRLGRQALAGPLRVGDGVVPRDVHDGMIVFPVDISLLAFPVPPPGPPRPLPPFAESPPV